MKLKDDIALVTGATSGIGRAIALAYAREGAHVAISGREQADLDAVSNEIRGMGRRCLAIQADLTRDGEPRRLWDSTLAHFGHVDILVNNAGMGSSANPKPLVDYDDDFWELLLKINLTVPYLLTKWALQHMAPRKYGRIIMTASINSWKPSMHGAAYSASKHGLMGLVKTAAVEHAKDGITVNAVNPGPVVSKLNNVRVAYDAKRLGRSMADMEASATPIGRRLVPDEIAPMAVLLASRDAGAITGQGFVIDGGIMAA
jgi:NAD(P)-dependent dehydrogenase (short-subunit alcohol dehydrogenase family)